MVGALYLIYMNMLSTKLRRFKNEIGEREGAETRTCITKKMIRWLKHYCSNENVQVPMLSDSKEFLHSWPTS